MRRGIWAAALAIFVAAGLIYFAGNVRGQDESASPTKAVKAADFALTDIDGKPVKLSDYKDKVVILDFWATWCPPCRKEIPHFNDLMKTYGDKGLVVLGVSVDQGGPEIVKKFKASNEVSYRVAMGDDNTYNVYQAYLPEDQRGGIPFTFVLDRKGVIRQQFVGYRDKEVFEGILKGLLKTEKTEKAAEG
jgi:peroxiredoxin